MQMSGNGWDVFFATAMLKKYPQCEEYVKVSGFCALQIIQVNQSNKDQIDRENQTSQLFR